MTNTEPAKKMKNILSSQNNALREEEKNEEDFFAGIPRGNAKTEATPKSTSPSHSLKTTSASKKNNASQKEERTPRENFLRALWTMASAISMLVNIVVVAVLIGLYQNYTILKIPEAIGVDTPKDLLQGLYDNFQLMDTGHITTNIPVVDTIPVQFDLDLKQQTNVVLSDDVTINGAYVTIDTALFDINAPATVVLPSGVVLPIVLDLVVPVNTEIPIELNVPVDIALEDTDLHLPFVGLQDVVQPLYCLVSPEAKTIGGEAVCP